MINGICNSHRFRQEVKSDLIERKVDVQELYQPLSPAMREIQTAILECMDATLSEIKRSNTSVRSSVRVRDVLELTAFIRYSSTLKI